MLHRQNSTYANKKGVLSYLIETNACVYGFGINKKNDIKCEGYKMKYKNHLLKLYFNTLFASIILT